jgi:DNA-binding XRE family transcriptional regulator
VAIRGNPRRSRAGHPSRLASPGEGIQADPWGPVAQQVLEAVRLVRPYGTSELLEGVVARARKLAADSERGEVAAEVRRLVNDSGLSQNDFADRIGTSRSRLSTYMSGKVMPSAALMVRNETGSAPLRMSSAWCCDHQQYSSSNKPERALPGPRHGRVLPDRRG